MIFHTGIPGRASFEGCFFRSPSHAYETLKFLYKDMYSDHSSHFLLSFPHSHRFIYSRVVHPLRFPHIHEDASILCLDVCVSRSFPGNRPCESLCFKFRSRTPSVIRHLSCVLLGLTHRFSHARQGPVSVPRVHGHPVAASFALSEGVYRAHLPILVMSNSSMSGATSVTSDYAHTINFFFFSTGYEPPMSNT